MENKNKGKVYFKPTPLSEAIRLAVHEMTVDEYNKSYAPLNSCPTFGNYELRFETETPQTQAAPTSDTLPAV